MRFEQSRLWLRRSTPLSVLGALALVLGFVALILFQLTVVQEDELKTRDAEVQVLQLQVASLTAELRCRSRVAGQVTDAQIQMIAATGRGLASLVNEDEAELQRQVEIILEVSDDLDTALAERAEATVECQR